LSNNTSGSMHNMSNRVTSLSTGDVLSSDGFDVSNLDFCVNDDCVDLDDDSGYYGPSYFIYTSLSDDINVRSLSESSAELLRVSDMKKLVVDGFIGSGGVSSSDSYYFTKSIGDDYQVVEVDKESFLVSNVYESSLDVTPVVVDDMLYFYKTNSPMLLSYDDSTKSFVDSTVVNNVMYLDGITKIEEIFIDGMQFYMLDVNGYEVVITDFKDSVIINNNDFNTFGNPVYFTGVDGDGMIMILGGVNDDDLVYYEFYQVDSSLNLGLVKSGSTKYNIGIDPQVATLKD